ncbi:MAG: beta-galactosidase [Acidobacteriales bacterium]|nr:beta-galactosidase [Terriglobales bacterium]
MAAFACFRSSTLLMVAVLLGSSAFAQHHPAHAQATGQPHSTAAVGRGQVEATKTIGYQLLQDYDKGESLDTVAADFALMRSLGIDTWRGSLGWDDYEPKPGQYDFAWLHAFASLANAYGIKLRPYIAYTAPWAADGGTDENYWNDPPKNIESWYRFLNTLARR